jgi:uncharacterized membrane protein
MILGGILGPIGLVVGVVTLFRKGTKKILATLGSIVVILLLMVSYLSLFIFTA